MGIRDLLEKIKEKRENVAYVMGAKRAEEAQENASERIRAVSTKEAVLRKKIEALKAEKRVKAMEREHRALKDEHIRKIGKQFLDVGVKVKEHYGLAAKKRTEGLAQKPRRKAYYVKKGKNYIKKYKAPPVIKSSEPEGIKRPSVPKEPFVEKSMLTGKPILHKDLWY